ncbi:formylglycine-generating enzyme family protein [Marinobacter sp.]|uniref:formylglycine-generating enzyme family protein n=1 Tax=Marinobacter sp. TaxID=50741 RepID=UPI003A8D2704
MRVVLPATVALVLAVAGYFYMTEPAGAPVGSPLMLCESYDGLPSSAAGLPDHGMVRLEGGEFTFGSDQGYAEEQPAYVARVDGFWIDQHPVTNAQFSQFVEATGYRTQAERGLTKAQLGDFPSDLVKPGSLVFSYADENSGWRFVEGASWRSPEGPESDILDRMHHPVVHVSLEDAAAYADWAGRSLPTEAQWEYAARGGLFEATFSWGNLENGRPEDMANVWQGRFPVMNLALDGFFGTSPVGCFPPNGFSLFDMGGNVWELSRTPYRPGHSVDAVDNPIGPKSGYDPRDPGVPVTVIKGGSHLCSDDYCFRYRPAARQPQPEFLSTSHIGFRTVSHEHPGG